MLFLFRTHVSRRLIKIILSNTLLQSHRDRPAACQHVNPAAAGGRDVNQWTTAEINTRTSLHIYNTWIHVWTSASHWLVPPPPPPRYRRGKGTFWNVGRPTVFPLQDRFLTHVMSRSKSQNDPEPFEPAPEMHWEKRHLHFYVLSTMLMLFPKDTGAECSGRTRLGSAPEIHHRRPGEQSNPKIPIISV